MGGLVWGRLNQQSLLVLLSMLNKYATPSHIVCVRVTHGPIDVFWPFHVHLRPHVQVPVLSAKLSAFTLPLVQSSELSKSMLVECGTLL